MRIMTACIASACAVAWMIGPDAAMAADEWGIEHEQKTRFEAVVVDILCELSGDCPGDCGAGKRQLGLLDDDGKLVPVVKNFDPFAGAVVDLLPFCGQRVVVDGLMIEDPAMRMFAVQFKRPAPDGEWSRANWFTRDWAAAHGGNGNQWFRADPEVQGIIEQGGVFGIPGLEPTE